MADELSPAFKQALQQGTATVTGSSSGSQTYNPVVTLGQLKPVQSIDVPLQAPGIDLSGGLNAVVDTSQKTLDQYIKEATPTPSATQTNYNAILSRFNELLPQTAGRTQALAQEQQNQGLPNLQKQLQDFNNQLLTGQAEIAKMDTDFLQQQEAILNQNTLTKAVAGAQAGGLQRTYALQKAAKASEQGLIAARAQATVGNINTALQIAENAVNARYAPIEDELKIRQAQLESILPILNKEQATLAEARQRMYEDERQRIADEKEKTKTLFNLGISNGVTKPFFSLGNLIVRTSDGKAYSTPNEAIKDGVDMKSLSNVQSVNPGGYGNFQKIGESVDEYGNTIDTYGFVDSKTGTIKPIGNTNGSFFATGNGLVSGNPNPSKLIQGYDFTSYATDPNWGNAIQNIMKKIPNLVNANIAVAAPSSGENLQAYIDSVAKNSPITAQMVFNSANKYGVDPKILASIIQHESKFGTLGVGAKTFNPGNVGNTDSGATRNWGSWQAGVDAVAENMSKRVVSPTQAKMASSNNPKTLAQTIFNGTGRISDVSTKGNLRAQVSQELNKLRDEALSNGDIYGVIRASAGGKDVDATFIQSFEKGVNVLYQIGDLQNTIDKEATGPIEGIIRSNNPYDTKAQQIKAQLQAIVPNLARGIYGEVGVLTDNDIANYSRTLPNLKSTEDVRNAILAITLKSVQRSLENKIRTAAGFGRDVSGIYDLYNQIEKKVKEIEASLNGQSGGNTDFRAWMSGNQSSTLDSLLTQQRL